MTKTRKFTVLALAIVCALSLCLSVGSMNFNAKAEEAADPRAEMFDMFIDASDFKSQNIMDVQEIGEFIITGTPEAMMSIDGNEKGAMDIAGYKFTKRFKTNGTTDHSNMARSISFFLEQKAEISVYALSSTASESTRTLSLYKNGTSGALQNQFVMGSSNPIEPITFTTTEAGSYYIAADVGGVNIYLIGIKFTGEAATVTRSEWATVETPTLSVPTDYLSMDGKSVTVNYAGLIGDNGADKIIVKMYDSTKTEIDKRSAIRYGNNGSVKFTPPASGDYYFTAEAVRANETDVKKSDFTEALTFKYVFEKPSLRSRTIDDGGTMKLQVTIIASKEATSYTLCHRKKVAAGETENAWAEISVVPTSDDEIIQVIEGYAVNDELELKVIATRVGTGEGGADEVLESSVINAVVRSAAERDWQFAYFGQSTKNTLNYMIPGGDIYKGLSLVSCTFNSDTQETTSKGGKFTYGAMDGISYYYTKIDASEEDFRLKTRVVVDYINPTQDGQEGFALLVRDSIGVSGETNYFYTNSAAAIATKLQYMQGATRKTIKDGLGARFVTGVTDTVNTPESGTFTQTMYPFMNEMVHKTVDPEKDGYIIEVEKVNNTYYTRYYIHNYSTGLDELQVEKALYHDGSTSRTEGKDQLLVIDKENVYVGFAVARGCNATFKDVEFEVTPRSTEPVEIQYEQIIGDYTITSKTTTSVPEYDLTFTANADGILNISHNGNQIITNQEVKANVDFIYPITFTEVDNTFTGTFDPTDGFMPGLYQEMDSYELQELLDKIVTYKKYGDVNTPIYVAPDDLSSSGPIGSAANDGTKDSPLDLQTAVNYVLPGQTIFMKEGTYTFGANLTIERGNNGVWVDANNNYIKDDGEIKYKILRPDPEAQSRPIIDFQNKGTGIKMWGEYWHMYGFDITKTKYANKGIQLGGKFNILESVNAYYNGDSGISVSGKSTEGKDKWPAFNKILNCTAYMNKDQAEEDADGFAAKLYCGDGNVFEGCIAYCNADDGWDLYAKTETGNIGAVTINNCLTFGNGFNIDGSPTKGNGNGFKLGGESLPGKHKLTNSVSFANKLKGIDSNSCPDDIVHNTTSVYNGSYNYAFYSEAQVAFDVKNVISLMGGKSDQITAQKVNPIRNETNYLYATDTGLSATTNGATVDMTIFKGWTPGNPFAYFGIEMNQSIGLITKGDFNKMIETVTVRKENGSINTNGILEIIDDNLTAGGRIAETPGTVWGDEVKNQPKSGCKKGCKSEVGAIDFVIGFALVGLAIAVLLKKQKSNG